MKKNSSLIDIGLRIRAERTRLGLSQEKLAAKAKLHRTYIGMVERAEKNITLLSLKKIATALNKSIKDLLP